ncbi:MAG TPA: EAL domain-containing protein [Steroidobacteraceae bacterium]|nr:EAL domain-containing protein [Steroidobacteraceae bacterium]
MTHQPTDHETPTSLLAPLARGLMRRIPEIVSLSIHDGKGHALWSSGDFLLAEDHALIAEVVEESSVKNGYDVRGPSCGLWWESADTARARCAFPVVEQGRFRGVMLLAYSGLTTGEEDRDARADNLAPALPVIGRAIRMLTPEEDPADVDDCGTTTLLAALHFQASQDPEDSLISDLELLEREENLMALIDAALRQDEFELHLQPIVSLRDADPASTGAPLIVEVLIRLPTADRVLASHEFLDTAERNGRMPAIDRWVIRALLVWMQRNRDRWADANAVFCVNLSGKSVVRPDFRDYLSSCLDKSGLPMSALRFEVSELDLSLAPQEFSAIARALIERGCEVAVDNAGTGTGRFDFLREVNADTLKIDGSLIQGASDDIVSRARINGLVHMADTLGMRTVASHVDTTSKFRAVKQLGVDYAQGNRLHEPEHIDSFDFVDCGIQLPAAAAAT